MATIDRRWGFFLFLFLTGTPKTAYRIVSTKRWMMGFLSPSLSLSFFLSLTSLTSLALSLSCSSCLHNQDGVDGGCQLVLCEQAMAATRSQWDSTHTHMRTSTHTHTHIHTRTCTQVRTRTLVLISLTHTNLLTHSLSHSHAHKHTHAYSTADVVISDAIPCVPSYCCCGSYMHT